MKTVDTTAETGKRGSKYVVQLWRQCFSLHFKALIFPLREWKFKKEVGGCHLLVSSTGHFNSSFHGSTFNFFFFNFFLDTADLFNSRRGLLSQRFFCGIFTFTSNVGLYYKTWPRATPPLFADTSVKKIISIFNPFSWAKCWARFTYQCRVETGSFVVGK